MDLSPDSVQLRAADVGRCSNQRLSRMARRWKIKSKAGRIHLFVSTLNPMKLCASLRLDGNFPSCHKFATWLRKRCVRHLISSGPATSSIPFLAEIAFAHSWHSLEMITKLFCSVFLIHQKHVQIKVLANPMAIVMIHTCQTQACQPGFPEDRRVLSRLPLQMNQEILT